MSHPKKLLVLGASSYVGQHLLSKYGCEDIIGTYNNHSYDGGVYFNSTRMKVTEILPDLSRISNAIIFLGDTQPDSCFYNQVMTREINVNSIKRILDELKESSVRPIFISSHFVFDGVKGNYLESDVPSPILVYGVQKLEIENYITELFDEYIIFRLSNVYGDKLGDKTLLTNFYDSVLNATYIRCAIDQYFSPIHVSDVCKTIMSVVNSDLSGLYNLGGPQRLSRIDCLNTILNEIKKYRTINVDVEPCSIDDFELPERRPKDVSLDVNNILSIIDFNFNTIAQSCKNIVCSDIH